MEDPFSADRGILQLGGHCSVCNRVVCVDEKCSMYYTQRYALDYFSPFETIFLFPSEHGFCKIYCITELYFLFSCDAYDRSVDSE